jgi:hypothetical protein
MIAQAERLLSSPEETLHNIVHCAVDFVYTESYDRKYT